MDFFDVATEDTLYNRDNVIIPQIRAIMTKTPIQAEQPLGNHELVKGKVVPLSLQMVLLTPRIGAGAYPMGVMHLFDGEMLTGHGITAPGSHPHIDSTYPTFIKFTGEEKEQIDNVLNNYDVS